MNAKTGQVNPLFNTFSDLVNRVEVQHNTDWMVCDIIFCLSVPATCDLFL